MFLGNQTDSQPDKKADTVTDEDRVNSFVSDVSNNEEPDKKADSGAPEQEQNAADDSQKADDAPEQEQSEDVADQPQSEDVTEQSQGSEEASEDAADNKDKRKPKPLSQRLKEINDATREMREAERRANEAISRLQKIQGESSPELTDEKTSDNKTSEGPDPKKFEFGEFDPLYLEERAAWRAEQKFNELIPFVYDTPRVVKVLGRDEDVNPEFVRINYTGDPNSVDITSGKYNVTIVTGPSYATKRIEAQESMQAAFNANPQAYGVAADLFAESWDWPGADKIAERIRRTMPPDILGEETTPEQQAQLQEQAQLAQEAQDIAKAKELADIALTEAKTEETQAKVYEIMATLGHKMEELTLKIDDLQMRAVKTAADIQSQETRDNLQTIDALTGENNVSG